MNQSRMRQSSTRESNMEAALLQISGLSETLLKVTDDVTAADASDLFWVIHTLAQTGLDTPVNEQF